MHHILLHFFKNLNYDQQFQSAVAKTSHGRRPPPVKKYFW
jgi:hypothetical protein